MSELLFKELSYLIRGACFEAFNNLGYGLKEKTYEDVVKSILVEKGVSVKQQIFAPIKFKGINIGKQYLDLLVDDKIIVELKTGNTAKKIYFDQIKAYLNSSGVQLGLLVLFSPGGAVIYRIINLKTNV